MKHGQRKTKQMVMIKANGYNPYYSHRVGEIIEIVTDFIVKVKLSDTKEVLKLYRSDLIDMQLIESIERTNIWDYYRIDVKATHEGLILKQINYIEYKDGKISINNVIKDKATRYRPTVNGCTIIKGKRIKLSDFIEY